MKCSVDNARGRSRQIHRRSWLVVALLFQAVYGFATIGAQESPLDTSPVITKPVPATPTPPQPQPANVPEVPETSSGRGSIVIAPIPISSPAIGTGGTILGGYIFPLRKSDAVSPPSVIGGAWVGTNNGTRAWVTAAELYFNQDRYHVLSGFSHGDLNYDFYGTGTAAGDAGVKFGLNQTGNVFFGEALRRTFWGMFVGPRMWFGTSKLEPQHLGQTNPELPPLGVEFSMRSLGLKIERDTVPNRFYPEQGSLFLLGSDFFSKDLGGTFTFQRYRLTFNYYQSLGRKQLLAYNLFGCSTGGDAPFFGQCIFGTQDELRGYPAGRYIDRKMLAIQAEYRRSFRWRLGLAAFGGLGEVAPTFSAFDAENILPSAGLGPRFMLSRKFHVNLRGDIAWGKTGNTFSMGMGESF